MIYLYLSRSIQSLALIQDRSTIWHRECREPGMKLLHSFFLMGLYLCSHLSVVLANSHSAKELTLILGAVPWEMTAVLEELKEQEPGVVHHIPYTRGELFGLSVVVALTGVSKTNTGMVAGALITEFNPVRVVFSGTGARVKPEIKAGYVFIIEETTFHDTGSLTEAGMEIGPVIGPTPNLRREPIFKPDPALFELAKTAAKTYVPKEPIQVDGLVYNTVVSPGTIVTGDLFSLNQWKYDEIVTKFRTDLFAMETAALGQVCTFMDVPWIAFRGGSDLIQPGDASDDYKKYGPIAARQAALFTLHFLQLLTEGV
jgi:adenosylhomocysteine nucleosidase